VLAGLCVVAFGAAGLGEGVADSLDEVSGEPVVERVVDQGKRAQVVPGDLFGHGELVSVGADVQESHSTCQWDGFAASPQTSDFWSLVERSALSGVTHA
jgi:hypothetical protein